VIGWLKKRGAVAMIRNAMADKPYSENSESKKSPNALREEETLRFWQDARIFEKSVETPAGGTPKGEYVFYDGPPFATGLPHYGHLLPGTIKDVIPRYKTMQGFRVPRKWGWDCHGLPIENLVEKELGLKTKKDIEEYGIEKFNEVARGMVLQYADDWRRIIPRSGRFVDMENDYKTMDATYTESIWWAFKTLHEKGLVYEGYKAMHLCPRCETTLANFEVNLGYKDITDISVYVKFALVDEPGTFFLAWTTTPWTLPGNVALAVNSKFEYVKIKLTESGEFLILAKERLSVVEASHEIVEEFSGASLVGKKYVPLFDYYENVPLKNFEGQKADNSRGWKVYGADFVTAEDGTGIVHIAPAFGEDDMNLARAEQLPFIQHVGTNGQMKSEVRDFAGREAKPKDNHESTDVEVIRFLAKAGALFAKKKIVHSYPHCWRCDTPLLNYASSSWFVKVTSIKDELIANNKKTNWVPEYIRDGRFGNWLEGARDWAISRSRFWGAPIPVWRCGDCKKIKVVASMEDLQVETSIHFVMRHGEAEHIVKGVADQGVSTDYRLTQKGHDQVRSAAATLRGKGIDMVVCSPVTRARETGEIVAAELGIDSDDVIFDKRLGEINFGEFDGGPITEYRSFFANMGERFQKPVPGGETLNDIRIRVGAALSDILKKYPGKKILFVGHESPLWMLAANAGRDDVDSALLRLTDNDFILPGEVKQVEVRALPHNERYELDLHRPYIDSFSFACDCGGTFARVPEVFDCWFESGAMPFAAPHYPFEHRAEFEARFPAEFIAEGLDQTRGWFYSLMVLSTALFGKPTFKQAVVNGLLLAEDGQKMSKRLKNYPEINYVFDMYGADALRYYLMNSPAVHAEDLNFSERGVAEVASKVVGRLLNVLSFYEQNKNIPPEAPVSVDLDSWILSRLGELTREMTLALDAYKLDSATRPIGDFVEDLSVWYLRRSRKSFSAETMRFVLETTAKLIAPVMPFAAEHIYQSVKGENGRESVHLESWPKVGMIEQEVLEKMKKTREIVEAALAARAAAKMKVRQPLALLSVPEKTSSFYGDLVADELNVKKIEGGAVALALDLTITEELKLEGEYRELIRAVQDLRKEHKLLPGEKIILTIPENQGALLAAYRDEFIKTVSATQIHLGNELSLQRE
jgi:isoleucyl-tRNA synthetase